MFGASLVGKHVLLCVHMEQINLVVYDDTVVMEPSLLTRINIKQSVLN